MSSQAAASISEPYVGQVFAPRPFEFTPELASSYWVGLAVERRDALPLMLANAADSGNRALFSQQRGHLWLRQEWEFSGRLEAGVTYAVEGSVVEIYPRKERTILLSETVLRDPSTGTIVSRQRHHQSFLLDQPGGDVVLRDPGVKEVPIAVSPATLREFASLDTTVTLEMCGEFFHGSRSYHADAEASRELGFRDVVVGGRMTMGYVGELLERELGEAWSRSGRLLVKFVNVLWPDESIRMSASWAGPDEGGRERVVARVEKADGTVVLVAEGSFER